MGVGAGVVCMTRFVGRFVLAPSLGLGAHLTEAEFHDAGSR